MPDFITSRENPLIKDVRKAIQAGTLTDEGYIVAESLHLLEEAQRSDCELPVVIAAEFAAGAVERGLRRTARVCVVPDALFKEVASTETSQGVIALVKPLPWKLHSLFGECPLIVVLDGVQDPGNAGTIVRAAEGFGATGILFLKGSVSPFNPKTVRASAGSLFRLPFVTGTEPESAKAEFARRKVAVYTSVVCARRTLGSLMLREPAAILIGSEGKGVSPIMRKGSQQFTIVTSRVESLNAAVAAAVILYEANRQRLDLDDDVPF